MIGYMTGITVALIGIVILLGNNKESHKLVVWFGMFCIGCAVLLATLDTFIPGGLAWNV